MLKGGCADSLSNHADSFRFKLVTLSIDGSRSFSFNYSMKVLPAFEPGPLSVTEIDPYALVNRPWDRCRATESIAYAYRKFYA